MIEIETCIDVQRHASIWVSRSLFLKKKCVVQTIASISLYCVHSSRYFEGFACSVILFSHAHTFCPRFYSYSVWSAAPLDGNKMENRTFHFLTPDRNKNGNEKGRRTDFSVSVNGWRVFSFCTSFPFFTVCVRIQHKFTFFPSWSTMFFFSIFLLFFFVVEI